MTTNSTIPRTSKTEGPYHAGTTAALQHFGVKDAECDCTPKTNETADVVKRKNPDRVADAGTGYATSGAQYGADTRR